MNKLLTIGALTGASVGITLCMSEVLLRLLPNPSIPLGIPHSELGVIYRPGFTKKQIDPESKKDVSIQINSYGFRDDEWDVATRPTIMVVGDSFTSAEGIDEPHRFSEILGATLHKDGWQGSVLNFGIAGSGPEAYIERIRKYGPVFSPERTIVVIFNGNDLENSNYDLTPATGRKNYMVRDGNVLAYRDSASTFEHALWNIKIVLGRSYLLQLMKDVWVKVGTRSDSAGAPTQPLPQYCSVPQGDLENSFVIMEKLLSDMDELSGHTLIVVSVPDKTQLRDDIPPGCDPQLVETRLHAMTSKLGIPFAALHTRFKEQKEELYFSGHLNERGHEVAADVLYETLNQD